MINNFMGMGHEGIFVLVVIVVIGIVIYLIPTFLALSRRKHQLLAICLLNIFAGWTGIGWLAALIWAALEDKKPVV
jgi:hypothetical protein